MTIMTSAVGGLAAKMATKNLFRWGKGAKLAQSLWKLGGDLKAGLQGLFKVQHEAEVAEGRVTAAVKEAASCVTGNSFSAETLVLMADGSKKPIKDVKIGDRVLATDTRTGKTKSRAVTALFINYDTDLLNVVVKTKRGTAVVETTEDHPFWDQATRSWVLAGDLTPQARLRTPDGDTATLVAARTPAVTTGMMWDLTVETDHNFYVTASTSAVLVHNSNCNSLTRAQSDDVAGYLGYTKSNKRSAGGAAIWENKKSSAGQPRYVTYDRTGHNKEAVFKGASFRNPFQSTKDSARDGTYGLDISSAGEVLGLKWLAK